MKKHKTPISRLVAKERLMDKAIALVKMGNSVNQAAEETGLHYKAIQREKVKRGVVKNDLNKIIEEKVEIEKKIHDCSDVEQTIINNEVAKRLAIARKLEQWTDTVCERMIDDVKDKNKVMKFDDYKKAQSTLLSARKTYFGKEPSAQINNNNNQNNQNPYDPGNLRGKSIEELTQMVAEVEERLGIVSYRKQDLPIS
jgi:hypothetical protein